MQESCGPCAIDLHTPDQLQPFCPPIQGSIPTRPKGRLELHARKIREFICNVANEFLRPKTAA
jgi:hypothetical protein